MLIEKYLPAFDVREYRELCVRAEPERAYAVLRDLRLNRSAMVRALFAIRTLPERLRNRHRHTAGSAGSHPFLEEALQAGWALLEEIPTQELVMGAITQPWVAIVHFRGMAGAEFVTFSEPGFAKIAWSIAARPAGPGRTVLSTETRVAATDAVSRRRFRRYWLIFSPGIKLIRRIALNLAAQELRTFPA
jgi:hypothetical protein